MDDADGGCLPFITEKKDKTTGVKYWHFCTEVENFPRASSLQGPRPLAMMLEHIRGGVVIYALGESPSKVSLTAHTAK